MKPALLALAASTLLLVQPARAEPASDASDNAVIDALIAPTLAGLKAGQSRQAVDAFLGRNPIMQGKASDIAVLASQIDSAMAVYGPIGDCQLTQTVNNGAWVQQRLYHCQHTNLVTRWLFQVVRTSKGWTPANLSFDDKVSNRLSE